jgi:hypothetical protein
VANSGNWKPVASMNVQSIAPVNNGETNGHFWLDSDTGILHLYYNGSWVPINDVAGDTRVVTRSRYDIDDVLHRTVEIVVNGQIVSITTSDATQWQPQNSGPNTEYLENGTTLLNTQFSSLVRGINLNQTNGYFFSGTATSALYADLAERYKSDNSYDCGTVVELGGIFEITATRSAYSLNVFGVISDKPAFAMNSGAGTNNTHPYVALSGRVPVKVIGQINKGDRLVSSQVMGHAMAAVDPINDWRWVIGRALENKINDEPGIIEAVVGTK